MGPGYGVLGAAILLFTGFDVLRTTLAQGGGPLTTRVTSLLWRLANRVSGHHGFLSFAGIGSFLVTILLWVTLVWVGWTFIFSSHPDAVVWQDSGAPASLPSRFYYTGYILVTLTMGDFEPGAPPWETLSVLATANGFFLITLAITYLLPVVQAATQKRQLALYISSLGRSADEILLGAWNGDHFRDLEPHLVALNPMLTLLAQRHVTYPALHYFHSLDRPSAGAPSIAALDEAVSLLIEVIPAECRPSRAALEGLRRTLTAYLETLEGSFVHAAGEAPPPPDTTRLRKAEVGLPGEAEIGGAFARLDERRRLLLAMVEKDGWEWSDLC